MTPLVSIGGIHLVNSSGTPSAGGVATAVTTTPFSIRRGFTIQSPEPLPIYGGGPPFRPGSSLVYSSYGNVDQTIPIHVTGSSHENAVARLRELKAALSAGAATIPPLFMIQPTGSSAALYGEILSGYVRDVSEEGSGFEAWEGGSELDAEIVFTQKPFFGLSVTGETVINAQSIISGAFTGSPDNIVPFTTGTGDLLSEGQPLNLLFTRTSGAFGSAPLFVATIDSVISDATTQTVTTTSQVGALSSSGDVVVVAPPLTTKQALGLRLIALNSTGSAAAQWRVHAYVSDSALAPFYTGPWNTATQTNGALDCGDIPCTMFRDGLLTKVTLRLEVRSTSGGSVTVTLTNFYLIAYYTMCRIANIFGIGAGAINVYVRGFVEATGRACLPLPRAETYSFSTADANQESYGQIDGTPPVYIAGASILLYSISGGVPIPGTFTLTARNAPLYTSLRGA